MDRSEHVYRAWLASLNFPYETLRGLMEGQGSAGQVYRAMRECPETLELPEKLLRDMRRNASEAWLDSCQERMERHHLYTLSLEESGYPEKLRTISDPPVILFAQGNADCLEGHTLAMIGSRAASYDGMRATRRIARDLSRAGVVIISGLAYGIDTASHEGCLEGESPTVAVLGCGLDQTYPEGNGKLRQRILEQNGLLLSEYAPGEKPLGWHFPVRNRIISGLSDAVIMMEAKIRSGSMRTVGHALEQGRDVFVYPGDPASPHCEGNHQLLREGGIYFTCAGDILEDMKWLDNRDNVGQNMACSLPDGCASEEEKAIALALMPGERSFEQLAEMTGLSPQNLMVSLTMLQIRGVIESLPGKSYRLKGHE